MIEVPMQVSNGKNAVPHHFTLKFNGPFSLLIRLYVRITRAACVNICSRYIGRDAIVLITKVTIFVCQSDRALSAVRPVKAAMEVRNRIVTVIRMIRGNVEVIDMIELTAERPLRQRELHAIKEPAP